MGRRLRFRATVDFVHGEVKKYFEEDTVKDKETTEYADDDGETTENSAAADETTETTGQMESTVKMRRLVDIVDHVQHALTSKTY